MQRARAFESNRQSVTGRDADGSASRPTPLTLVSGVVAGEDLPSVAATVAQALGRPVAIAIPALGAPVVMPAGALDPSQVREIQDFARLALEGGPAPAPPLLADAVAIRIGEQPVGIVACAQTDAPATGSAEQRAWLEAAAAAASVTALLRGARDAAPTDAAAALIGELRAGVPGDLPGLLGRARRLGVELDAGATAICARREGDRNGLSPAGLGAAYGTLLAESAAGRLLGLAPLSAGDGLAALAAQLREHGFAVALSAPRRDPGALHEALGEAELLVELAGATGAAGQEHTYRLLIGVLLRDPEELTALRDSTISALVDYDARHDTELMATLHAFLAHDGSTTETAEALRLHRHTVGYRLSRVHEVSGLSPYESDGRERLGLGLKAEQILAAARRTGRPASGPAEVEV